MASKKKKRVKKYAAGGDLRKYINPDEQITPYTGTADELYGGPNELTIAGPGLFGPGGGGGGGGGGGFDDTATGQVRQVSQSARRAANQLSQAGLAQQRAGSMLGNTGRSTYDYGPYLKKGGKVKKSAKKSAKTSVKVRGAGKAIKGVRPAKMVSMKGS